MSESVARAEPGLRLPLAVSLSGNSSFCLCSATGPAKPCPCYAETTDWLPRGDLMRERRQPLGNSPAVCPTTVALCTVEPLEVLTLSR